MHDINAIRKDPDAFDAGLAKRGVAPQAAIADWPKMMSGARPFSLGAGFADQAQ